MKKIGLLIGAMFALLLTNQAFAQKPTKQLIVSQYYEGGQDSLYAFINRNIQYPIMAKKNRIQGECLLSIKIDEKGNVTSARVLKAVGGTCSDEAVRVVKLIKFAKSPGWAVDADISVHFVLPK